MIALVHLVLLHSFAFSVALDADALPQRSSMHRLYAIDELVIVSRRLLAGGSLLATELFFNEFNARAARSKTHARIHKHTRIDLLNVSLATAVDVLSARRKAETATVDWIVLAGDDFFQMTPVQARELLIACEQWTHFGVMLSAGGPFDESHVCHNTPFVYVDDQSTIIGHHAHVYNLRRLIRITGKSSDSNFKFPFIRTSSLQIAWTDVITFAGVEFRAHMPAQLQSSLRAADIVIFVISGRPQYRNVIRQTWAASMSWSPLAIAVVFVVAKPTKALVNEAMTNGDVMIIEAAEGYSTSWSVLPLKSFGGLQLAAKHARAASWFFKCDDDTYVNVRKLHAHLNIPTPSTQSATSVRYVGCATDSAPFRIAKGEFAKWNTSPDVFPPHRYPRFMSGGAGYALSRSAALCVADAIGSPEWQYFDHEDVMMRLTLAEHCSPISVESHCERFNHGFVFPQSSTTLITTHHVSTPEKFTFLHRKAKG